MENNICRACLVTSVKLYNMETFSILTAYFNLTGISEVGIYTHICYECAARLRKCEEFRSICFKAHDTLRLKVNKEDVERERKLQCLESPLKLTNIITCECNDQHSLNYTEIKLEPSNIQSNTENYIKCELIENRKQENDVEHNISCEFDDEMTFSHYNTKQENEVEHNISSEFDDEITFSNHNTEQDNKIKHNISCKFDDEITFSHDNSPKIEENYFFKDNTVKAKKRKAVKIKDCKVYSESIDDEPLSKLCKEDNKKPGKDKITQDNTSKSEDECLEDYLTVTLMSIEDAKREVELRKESRNYKNCHFRCDLCYRGYGAQNAYNNHMKKHSPCNGTHECEFCFLRFIKKHKYNHHMVTCHKQKFNCKLCSYICFSRKQARLHVQLHKGVKYTCDLCQETFSMPNTLLSHKRIKHPTEVVCALCGSTFANSKGLNSHYLLVHKQETNDKKGPQCAECDVHFATELAWKRHLVLSSKHEVSNGCEICGETFPDVDLLKSHVKSHAIYQTRVETSPIPPLPAACSICDKWLTTRDEFKKHMTSQHPDCDVTKQILASDNLPCVCEFCGKGFKKRSFMIYHQRKHTGERPYKCNVCQKTFRYPGSLYVHNRIHKSKKMFKCDLCEKVFKTKVFLSRHVKETHLNIRPHSCDVCGKSYHNPCQVKKHKQHVHENVPWPKRDRSNRNKASKEHTDLNID